MDLYEFWGWFVTSVLAQAGHAYSLIAHHSIVLMGAGYGLVCVANRVFYRSFSEAESVTVANPPIRGQQIELHISMNTKVQPRNIALKKAMFDERQPRNHLFSGNLDIVGPHRAGKSELKAFASIPPNIPPGRWMIELTMLISPNRWNPLFKLMPVQHKVRTPVEVCQQANPACPVTPEECPHAKKG